MFTIWLLVTLTATTVLGLPLLAAIDRYRSMVTPVAKRRRVTHGSTWTDNALYPSERVYELYPSADNASHLVEAERLAVAWANKQDARR